MIVLHPRHWTHPRSCTELSGIPKGQYYREHYHHCWSPPLIMLLPPPTPPSCTMQAIWYYTSIVTPPIFQRRKRNHALHDVFIYCRLYHLPLLPIQTHKTLHSIFLPHAHHPTEPYISYPLSSQILASAAEAELATLSLNTKKATHIRTILVEMKHPQSATPIQTDNKCAAGIANDTIKQNKK